MNQHTGSDFDLGSENWNALLPMIRQHKARAEHWRSAHYDSARWYQRLEYTLGVPSVMLATVILGFAFYAVDRPNAPIWTQYTLAVLAILQGVLTAVQLYLRPSALAERHRNSAADFSTSGRRWLALEQKIITSQQPTQSEFDDVLSFSNEIAREARPLPSHIIRRYGRHPNFKVEGDALQAECPSPGPFK